MKHCRTCPIGSASLWTAVFRTTDDPSIPEHWYLPGQESALGNLSMPTGSEMTSNIIGSAFPFISSRQNRSWLFSQRPLRRPKCVRGMRTFCASYKPNIHELPQRAAPSDAKAYSLATLGVVCNQFSAATKNGLRIGRPFLSFTEP